jgi:hypothetical protein
MNLIFSLLIVSSVSFAKETETLNVPYLNPGSPCATTATVTIDYDNRTVFLKETGTLEGCTDKNRKIEPSGITLKIENIRTTKYDVSISAFNANYDLYITDYRDQGGHRIWHIRTQQYLTKFISISLYGSSNHGTWNLLGKDKSGL